MLSLEASIRMHSSIDIVVLTGTALLTVLTPLSNSLLEHTILMTSSP